MGGWDDDTAVQRKAQLRLLASLPALRLQDSAERAEAPGIAYHPVPEVQRNLRRDGRPETHQHVLSAALPNKLALPEQTASFIETMDCLPVTKLPDGPEWTYEIKLDGYRLDVVRKSRTTALYSRRENVLNQKFS
jgi:ATP-dependent DNA ligase